MMENAFPHALACGQPLLLALLSPLLSGWIRKVKAWSQGRRGPGLLQSYHDLVRLFRKDMVVADTASWIFHATPWIVLASTLCAAAFVPVVVARGALLGFADVVAIVYILALGKFFTALAGLDTGTAFGGEGSSREMTVGLLVEPMVMLAVFAAAVAARTTNVAGVSLSASAFLSPSHLLAFAAFAVAIVAETGRIPVDNPDTHLELTMIHEGMLLEYSGRFLALIEWAHSIRQMLLLTLAADLFFPYGLGQGPGLSAVAWATKMFVAGTALALTESSRVKLRFFKLPALLGGAFVLALVSLLTFMVTGR